MDTVWAPGVLQRVTAVHIQRSMVDAVVGEGWI